MSATPCSWCGKPASRQYPGRAAMQRARSIVSPLATPPDCYLCPDCDALVQAGKPLPEGVATFSVAIRDS